MRRILSVATALAAALVASGPAQAQFYKGKTVTILVNYPAGGPTDIEARLVGRHLGKHIPGAPTVIVKNMPGGGGNIAANYLGEIAKDDPTQVAYFTWNPLDQLTNDPGLRVKYDAFRMVAGFEQPVVTYVRKDAAPGIKQPADLVKAVKVKAAGLAPNNHMVVRMALALDVLGVKYDLVAGYKGLKETETAVLQNEAQLSNISLSSFRSSVEPTMVKTGIVLPVYQYDIQDETGAFRQSRALPDVPTLLTLYRQINGADKTPSGVKWDTLVLINAIMDSLYRTVMLPPNASAEAVADMRKAFGSLAQDPEFVAGYEQLVRDKPTIISGERAEAVIRRLADVKPDVVAFLNKYVAEASR
jgi:tripartite-type tricarboxylate transporter receptor subunit TctC